MERQDLNQCPSIVEGDYKFMVALADFPNNYNSLTFKKSSVRERKNKKKEEICWNQSVIEVKSVSFSLPGNFMVPGHKYVGFGGAVFFLLSS